MRTKAYEAMMWARELHKDQVRKYTGNPYADHLAEVVGIAMSVGWHDAEVHPDDFMAVCWLHDSREDQGVGYAHIADRFGADVAYGVTMLSDLEEGNRSQRKAASRDRLAKAPGWVQTIKCADLISNTGSIVRHDPKFASVYLEEKRALLAVLTRADRRLLDLARMFADGHSVMPNVRANLTASGGTGVGRCKPSRPPLAVKLSEGLCRRCKVG